MMNHTNYHLLLSRGRKAGLSARELNSALSVRPVVGNEQQPGQSDCNGYVSGIDSRGHRTYRPVSQVQRP
jgi:hypothetical protein